MGDKRSGLFDISTRIASLLSRCGNAEQQPTERCGYGQSAKREKVLNYFFLVGWAKCVSESPSINIIPGVYGLAAPKTRLSAWRHCINGLRHPQMPAHPCAGIVPILFGWALIRNSHGRARISPRRVKSLGMQEVRVAPHSPCKKFPRKYFSRISVESARGLIHPGEALLIPAAADLGTRGVAKLAAPHREPILECAGARALSLPSAGERLHGIRNGRPSVPDLQSLRGVALDLPAESGQLAERAFTRGARHPHSLLRRLAALVDLFVRRAHQLRHVACPGVVIDWPDDEVGATLCLGRDDLTHRLKSNDALNLRAVGHDARLIPW